MIEKAVEKKTEQETILNELNSEAKEVLGKKGGGVWGLGEVLSKKGGGVVGAGVVVLQLQQLQPL